VYIEHSMLGHVINGILNEHENIERILWWIDI